MTKKKRQKCPDQEFCLAEPTCFFQACPVAILKEKIRLKIVDLGQFPDGDA